MVKLSSVHINNHTWPMHTKANQRWFTHAMDVKSPWLNISGTPLKSALDENKHWVVIHFDDGSSCREKYQHKAIIYLTVIVILILVSLFQRIFTSLFHGKKVIIVIICLLFEMHFLLADLDCSILFIRI